MLMILRSTAVFVGLFHLIPFLSAAERPNFVVFIADDVSWNDFGCYGNQVVRTPHIDQLANGGLLFTNAYLTASSCSPSRLSIMTGRYPHNNGDACELHRPLSAHLVKFPALLKSGGYYTALAGKHHMPQKDGDDQAVWDAVRGGRVKGNSGGEAHWLDVVKSRPADQPFFFWFASFDAHRRWDADLEWQESKYGAKHDPAAVRVPAYMVDVPTSRQDIASYYNEVTRFDWFVGQVVAELENQQVLNNTVVLVMADNGRPFPRAKTRVHDSGMKTPLVVHWPQGIKAQGVECRELVSSIDICPTLLQLADVDVPAQVQGVSFSELLANPAARLRDYAFSEHNWHDYQAHGRAVRDREGYLYIRNARPQKAWLGPADSVGSPAHKDLLKAQQEGTLSTAQADVLLQPRPAEELYYTPDDPLQIHSLAASDSHANKLVELRRVLDEWQDATGDTVPADYSPDFFDRKLGYISSRTGKRIKGPAPMKTAPGVERRADHINRSGPK